MAEKNFFKDVDLTEDLDEFTENIKKGEELYNEVHGLFKRVSGSNSGVMGMSSTTSLAELSRSMSAIRSSNIDAVNKRFMAKKTIIELKMKQDSMNNGEQNMDQIQLAKSLIQEVISSRMNLLPPSTPQNLEYSLSREEELKRLDDRVNKEIQSGNVKITANENAMKYDFMNVVDFQYDVKSEKIVPVNNKSGTIIPDYPQDRIPRMSIVRVEANQAISNSGMVLPIYKGR